MALLGVISGRMDQFSGQIGHNIAIPHMIGALKGLEYIHENNILHRDLKSDNILFQGDGTGKLVPKISDFGISKKYSEAGGSITISGIGMGKEIPERYQSAAEFRLALESVMSRC